MTGIYLVRHGATAWSGARFCGRTDLPLTDAGRAQARALAERFAAMPLIGPRLGSSPALRARETAASIAARLGLRVELDDRLREVDFGLVEGCTFADLVRTWPAIARSLLARDREIDWPEGERAAAFGARIADVARALECVGADVIVVSHGGTIRALIERLRPGVPTVTVDPGDVFCLGAGAPILFSSSRQEANT